jgi:hypothetical protein
METTQIMDKAFELSGALSRNIIAVCAVLGIISIGWQYSKRLMYSSSNIDWGIFVKFGILVVFITAYKPIMMGFIYAGNLIEISVKPPNLGESVAQYNLDLMNKMQGKLEAMESAASNTEDVEIKSEITNSNILICSILLFVFHFVTDGIFTIRDLLIYILIALGPVAIAFTVLKILDKSLSYWFKTLMSLMIWKAVIFVGYQFLLLIPPTPEEDWVTIGIRMLVNICFGLFSFKIAGYLVKEAITGVFYAQYFTLKN